TPGSDERVRKVQELGADLGINYRTQDFVEEIKKATDGRGVNVILDMVAGEYINRNLKCLADDGRAVIIALLGGAKATIDAGQILRRRLTVTGSTLRPRPVAFKGAIARNLRQHVWPLFAEGKIRPVVHATFPLAQVADAHAMMDAGEQIGKIILTME
ncbi:MAG TPA: zinc-binding dehydrogenase, partial [Burkholderiaceae bacterium]|nr:zinc-binding dehydrogenase [Burkholderiaceae bacterium]